MKGKVISFVLILFVLVIMAITNPTKADYVSWIKEQATRQTDNSISAGLISLFGGTLIDSETTTKNFIFFTIFTTNAENKNAVTVGLFHNFIPSNMPSNQQNTSSSNTTQVAVQRNETTPAEPVTTNSTPIKPATKSGGTVRVVGSNGTFNLPLIGVATSYGFDPKTPPTVLPANGLPDINYDIPADLKDKLAVYWINDGNNTTGTGMTFLAPKAWIVTNAGIGANGSSSFTLVSNSSNNPEKVTFRQDGAYVDSVVDIGTYFPNLKAWAIKNDPASGSNITPPEGIRFVPLGSHTVSYSFTKETDAYETNGVAIENNTSNPIFFADGEVTSPDIELARTILNFYLNTNS